MALIIGGLNGSGKTSLRVMCDSHPLIEVTEEFQNFMKLNVCYKEHVQTLRTNWNKFPLFGSTRSSQVRRRFKGCIFLTRYLIELQVYRRKVIDVGIVEKVLRRIFPNAVVVGDVHRHYILNLENFVGVPGLSIAIIYRDCRDVAATMAERFNLKLRRRERPWAKIMDTSMKLAKTWVDTIEVMERYADKIHMIRYEELVTNPESVLEEFGNWLDVDPQGFRSQLIHSDKVGEYKRCLSGKEVSDIIVVAGPTLKRLGYEV